MEKEKIVVIGGGFAGLNLCKHLDRDKYDVCLVDRNNFHCFPPLFYQVASSGLVSANICFPFRRELKKLRNVSYHMGHVKDVDLGKREITTSYETISYDRLVIYILQHIAPAAAAAHEISAAAPLGRLTRLLLEKTRKKIR